MHCTFAITKEHDLLFDAHLRLSDLQNKTIHHKHVPNKTRGQNHERGNPKNKAKSIKAKSVKAKSVKAKSIKICSLKPCLQ